MLYIKLEKSENLSFLPTAIKKGLDFVINMPKYDTLPNGRYEIEGDNVFANVMNYVTESEPDKRAEVHQKYLDIQVVLSGQELILYGESYTDINSSESYDEENDFDLFNQIKEEQKLILSEGYAVIFFPGELHKPGCSIDGPNEVRKLVIKVKKDLL
ncbi:DUF386 domain-containing protein [Vibrio vulnificus]|nr:DUF386 domain-containing protein [Vibrio vulnificus]